MLRFPSVAAPVTWPGRAEQGGQGFAEPLGLPESSAPRGCPFPEPSQPWQGPAGPGGHLGLARGAAARARLRGAGAAPVDPGQAGAAWLPGELPALSCSGHGRGLCHGAGQALPRLLGRVGRAGQVPGLAAERLVSLGRGVPLSHVHDLPCLCPQLTVLPTP